MGKEKDITGIRFGKLIAIKKDKSKIKGSQKRCFWIFKCDCGNIVSICKNNVIKGLTKSCGCLKNEYIPKNKIHGLSDTRIYQCWLDMKHRCYLKTQKNYQNYGGRGIKVCDEWLEKENGSLNFINWALENGYKDNLTLDRIDVNGNYCPKNCRWATIKQQANNTRTNNKITINRVTHNLIEWCKILKVCRNTYYYRKSKGLSDEDALLCRFDNHGNLLYKIDIKGICY